MGDQAMPQARRQALEDRPVILLGRGYSGSRLLALLAQRAGLFIGSDLNASRDSLEMAPAVYAAVEARATYREGPPHGAAIAELRAAGRALLDRGGRPEPWGFKLPECLLLLPELRAAFPAARFIFLKRDPLLSAAGREHPTAMPGIAMGAASLLLASRSLGLDPAAVAADSAVWRLAVTTAHQLSQVLAFRAQLAAADWLELSLERSVVKPQEALSQVAAFLGKPLPLDADLSEIDAARALRPRRELSAEEAPRVRALLAELRWQLGYRDLPG